MDSFGLVTLDVFGHAPRESAPWEQELIGLYASPHTVVEMKRTNRDKDWAFITALGARMVEAEDDRGWLHLFNAEALTELLRQKDCPAGLSRAASQLPGVDAPGRGDSRPGKLT